MKICAYMAICLSLPFALLAEDVETDDAATSSDEGVAATPAAQAEGFKRYKAILDRMPFGIPPPGFNPDAPGGSAETPQGAVPGSAEEAAAEAAASEVEQQILSSVTVSMLNRSPDGRVFVGFTDKSVQPPRNYMLRVGEKREGCEWLVMDADPDNGQVKLSKDGVEATLKMGGGGDSSSGAKGKEGGSAPKNAVANLPPGSGPRFQRPHPMARPADAKAAEEGKMSGLDIARARRQERRQRELAEAERQRQAAEQAKLDREQERKEREQERKEREQAAEERKAQLAQLMQIQEELRRQREEKQQTEEERQARDTPPPQETN